MATTITLEDEIDISRGDMIVKTGDIPKYQTTYLVWLFGWMKLNEVKSKLCD